MAIKKQKSLKTLFVIFVPFCGESLPQATISVTVPAPTVRPPSRIANRSPFSSATGLPFIQEFLEHLHARDHRLERRPESHDLHLLAHLHHTTLDPSRHHRPPA